MKVPIVEEYAPNVFLSFDIVGHGSRTIKGENSLQVPKRPAFASGQIELTIPAVKIKHISLFLIPSFIDNTKFKFFLENYLSNQAVKQSLTLL